MWCLKNWQSISKASRSTFPILQFFFVYSTTLVTIKPGLIINHNAMTMKQSFSILTGVLFLVSIVSCSKNNTEGRHIPAGSSLVIHVNLPSLSSKLSWSEVKKHSLFMEAYGTDSAWIKDFLDSPAVSGINTNKGMFVFTQSEHNGGFVAVTGEIKDKTAFKAFCSHITGNSSISKQGDLQFITRYPGCMGWSNERFIYVIDAPQMQRMDKLNRRMQQDSIDITDHTPRDLLATCKSLFDLEEKKSLAVDERFSNTVKEEADLHVWGNTALFYKDLKSLGPLEMINLENFYKESITAAAINFENGLIKINAHSYSNKALSDVFKKYAGGKINEEMLRRIPGSNVVAAAAINYNPEALLEIAKVANLDGILNSFAPSLGFTTNDFIKANKGDLVLAVSDFKMVPDSAIDDELNMPVAPWKPSFNLVAAVSVADKTSFDKLYQTGSKASSMFMNTQEFPLFSAYNDRYFVMANAKENAEAFINSNSAGHSFTDKITGNPVGAYINLHSLIKTVAEKDSTNKALFDSSLKMWEHVYLTGGNFANGSLNYTIEIHLQDKNTNSLKQLNHYTMAVNDILEQKRKKELEDMRALQDALPPDLHPQSK